MQLTISIDLHEPCILPIAYHHILQSAIYAQIGGELHDVDFKYDKRGYKLFTFGPLEGRYDINNRNIIFKGKISFEVRCFVDEIGLNIINNITRNGIRLGHNTYKDVAVKTQRRFIESNSITISMKSPVCVYATDDNKHTIYFNPNEEDFYYAVEDNFFRKYAAVMDEYPEEGIAFRPVKHSPRDRYFTKYKGFYIEAWKGIYELSGNPEYLNFLYDVGIGAKNSQGFGMFDIVK